MFKFFVKNTKIFAFSCADYLFHYSQFIYNFNNLINRTNNTMPILMIMSRKTWILCEKFLFLFRLVQLSSPQAISLQPFFHYKSACCPCTPSARPTKVNFWRLDKSSLGQSVTEFLDNPSLKFFVFSLTLYFHSLSHFMILKLIFDGSLPFKTCHVNRENGGSSNPSQNRWFRSRLCFAKPSAHLGTCS